MRKDELMADAKARGIKGADVRVLSIDPYFVGSDSERTAALWAAELWDRMMEKRRKPLHLRGFHYWIQSQGILKPNGEKYAQGADPKKDWGELLRSTQLARYLGIGEWRNLIDLKHPDPVEYDSYYVGAGLNQTGEVDIQEQLNSKLTGLVDEFISELARLGPRYSTAGYQTYHLEVWCEKNSMNFILDPLCKKYGATLQSLVGQSSVEKVNLCAQRAIRAARAGKKVRIFYISDWDRYGAQMPAAVARKLEFFLDDEEGLDVKLINLALTDSQIKQYNLPKAPKHGEAVVELDALEAIYPGELGKIVSDALAPYYDNEKPKIVDAENTRIRNVVKDMLEEKLRKPLEETFEGLDLAGIAGDVDLTEAINQNFKLPEPSLEVEEGQDGWIYDSTRDYWTQWEQYKLYKGQRVEEEA